jgi:glycosyltransferase involved in cell wall biosynthesis
MFFAGCPALVDSAKNAGITVPCVPMMPPIDLDLWSPKGDKLAVDGVTDKDVVFMTNANWIPRKNFGDLLVGFCCALHGVKDAVLIVKTWGGDNSADFARQVRENVSGRLNSLVHINRPRVMLITDILPEAQVVKLMRRADVYVTVSHGEGFDLPAVQAMSLGKVVVSTRFLGHAHYMTEENSIPVRYSLVPVVDAKAPGYAADQMWSRPNVDHFMECIRKAYNIAKHKSGDYEDISQAARSTAETKFHKDVTTQNLIDVLTEIQSGQPTGAG